MVEWCHCPQGDLTNKVLCLLSALFPTFYFFLETLHRLEWGAHMALHPATEQTRELLPCSMLHQPHAVSVSPGSSLCLLFICKQFWPPTQWLYLQQCQSAVCSVDFTLIICFSTCCQAATLFCLVSVMKCIRAVQEQPSNHISDFSSRCLKID